LYGGAGREYGSGGRIYLRVNGVVLEMQRECGMGSLFTIGLLRQLTLNEGVVKHEGTLATWRCIT